MSYDVSLLSVPSPTGWHFVAHDPACEVVQKARERDEPIATMTGCEKPLSAEIELHDCFKP